MHPDRPETPRRGRVRTKNAGKKKNQCLPHQTKPKTAPESGKKGRRKVVGCGQAGHGITCLGARLVGFENHPTDAWAPRFGCGAAAGGPIRGEQLIGSRRALASTTSPPPPGPPRPLPAASSPPPQLLLVLHHFYFFILLLAGYYYYLHSTPSSHRPTHLSYSLFKKKSGNLIARRREKRKKKEIRRRNPWKPLETARTGDPEEQSRAEQRRRQLWSSRFVRFLFRFVFFLPC